MAIFRESSPSRRFDRYAQLDHKTNKIITCQPCTNRNHILELQTTQGFDEALRFNRLNFDS